MISQSYPLILIAVFYIPTSSYAHKKPQTFTTIYNSSMQLAEPQRKYGRINGDFIIGALFPVHESPTMSNDIHTCGYIREMYGIQRVEAAFYAIDLINNNPNLLPNYKLGIEIRDECWSAPVSLHQTLKLIYESVSRRTCDYNNSSMCKDDIDGDNQTVPLIGVLGPGASSVTIPVQNLLQLFDIPQIGYSTTSEDFSDKKRYKYFLRVVPSDHYQAQVMVDILIKFNWTYINVVYTDENYGSSGIKIFKEIASSLNICIAKEDRILSTSDNEDFDAITAKLQEHQKARVVVCFCEGMTVRGLLGSIKRNNYTRKFLFIGSDGWTGRLDVVKGLEDKAQGSLMIRIRSPHVHEFDAYYLSLHPNTNTRNPWFKEFWQYQFNCTFRAHRNVYQHLCSGREKMNLNYSQDPKLSLVIKGIYTFAHGLHNMINDICGINKTTCKDLYIVNGSQFLEYLMNVSFVYKTELVKFDKNGDVAASYDIMNFQRMQYGVYDYVQVGTWESGYLNITDMIQHPGAESKPFESVCSDPCISGFKKEIQNKTCCWLCIPCSQDELSDGTTCFKCPFGFHPNLNKSECVEMAEIYIKWRSIEVLITIVFSYIGITLTFVVAVIFIIYNDTPVVKSSTKELSCLMLFGMCLSYCVTFSMIAKPSRLSCTISRILPGFSFAIIYSCLFMKTNRIARILSVSKKKFPNMNLRYVSTKSQIFFSITLIGIELIICIVMIIIEPALPTKYLQSDQLILTCNTSVRGLLIPFIFNGFLVLMCMLYAFKTRGVPHNFNEAKFIGFSMYTTFITWIAFGLIYFSSSLQVGVACICISTNAFVILIFLFFPKVYIILFKPERNDRAHFITTTGLRIHFGCSSNNRFTCRQCRQNLLNNSSSYTPSIKNGKLEENREYRSLSCQTSFELLNSLIHPIFKESVSETTSSEDIKDTSTFKYDFIRVKRLVYYNIE